jgi:predicted ArsR family transcriptional regulator
MMKQQGQLKALAALSDEVRSALYRYVRRQDRPVTREEAAAAARISVKLAAFHLDKLVDRGLLQAGHEVPGGVRRRVGRAPKRYSVSDREFSVSLPERRYELAGEILVDSLARVGEEQGGRQPADVSRRVAWDRGWHLGAGLRERRNLGRPGPERTVAVAEDLLDQLGYEPARADGGGLVLRNCPFHALAQRQRELVCGLNAAFVDGMLRGLGNESVRADLRPEPGMCCVCVCLPGPG